MTHPEEYRYALGLLRETSCRDVVVAGNNLGIIGEHRAVLILYPFDPNEQVIVDWATANGATEVEDIFAHESGFDVIVCNIAQ